MRRTLASIALVSLLLSCGADERFYSRGRSMPQPDATGTGGEVDAAGPSDEGSLGQLEEKTDEVSEPSFPAASSSPSPTPIPACKGKAHAKKGCK